MICTQLILSSIPVERTNMQRAVFEADSAYPDAVKPNIHYLQHIARMSKLITVHYITVIVTVLLVQ